MTLIDEHDLAASINVPGGTLDVISASITLDESWSPYVKGTLTCATPSGSVLELIDPRDEVRASIVLTRRFGGSDPASLLSDQWAGKKASDLTTAWAGLRARDITAEHFYSWNSFGARASQYRSLNLSVRSRKRGHRDGTMDLTVASDEALLQDYALVDTVPYTPALSSVRAVVSAVLGRIGRVLVVGDADGTIDPASSAWNPGIKAWDYVLPIVQAVGLRLWCDEFGLFHLDGSDTSPVGTLVVAVGSNITDADDTIDRDSDDWYDAVVITYQWTDDLGAQHTAYDAASTPGFTKPLSIVHDNTPYPGPGAAQVILNRRIGYGRSLSPTAVSDYRATPGMGITATLDDTPVQTGFLGAVTWTWPQREMTLTTRGLVDTPDAAWVFLDADESWLDSPTGGTWLDETIGVPL